MSAIWKGSAARSTAWQMLAVILLLGSIHCPLGFGQNDAAASPPAAQDFPDGITPGHVYVRIDLLDRVLDRLLAELKVTAPEVPPVIESQLGPLHVYQMVLACGARMQEFDELQGVLAVPTLSLKPKNYAPRDVRFVVDLMLESARRNSEKLNIADLPDDEAPLTQKTPTDVFARAMSVYMKLSVLCGHDHISFDDVYVQIERAAEDVRSILRQADEESRYRIDVPSSPVGLQITDVFIKCLEIRRLLNEHRVAIGEAEVPVPELPADNQFEPQDVFYQTQIIIAELNNLKLHTNTFSSTPLPIPVSRTKVPSDVHQMASLLEYLLRQVNTGREKQDVQQE